MSYIFSGSDSEKYFAAKPANETASALLSKGSSFFNLLRANAYLEKLQRMWQAYHGVYSESYVGYTHRVNFTGEQGELVQLPVNHFRNLAQHIYVMITANRPVMEARAINTDYKSLAQTYLANGILDYYMREKRLEDALKKATELSIVLGAGFVKLEWNSTAGEEYDTDPDTGEIIRNGELEFTTLTPLDVVVDGTKENWDNDWILVRSFKNRFNLMAKYPEMADKIKAIPPKNESAIYRLAVFSNDDTDDIPVYEFYHKRTEAMPEGRYMLFCDTETVLIDAKMPYRVIPVFRIAPSDILGTPYGYSPMFDIFPIQEAINSLYGTIMTNQNTFGVQNVWIPKGGDINVHSLSGGMNVIESLQKPEALNLTQTPAEVFKYLEMLIQAAETISGVNSVARGNPEASLKSGNALALVQSMALQFISGLQQSYVKLVEDVGTAVIQILKDYATAPKVVALVGKNNRPLLKEFTSDDISSINRVVVDVGNPLSKTIAGRVQMAEQMLQMNLIKDPMQYFQVMNTGRLDSMFEGEQAELLNIKRENEKMLDGSAPLVAPTDKHSIHIEEHKAVLSDPDLREDPVLTKTVMDHIEAHMNALRNTDPELLKLCGETPLPPIQPPGAPQGAPGPQQSPPGGPQGPGPGQVMQPPPQGMVGAQDQLNVEGQNIGMPSMPKPPAPFSDLPVSASQMAPPNLG